MVDMLQEIRLLPQAFINVRSRGIVMPSGGYRPGIPQSDQTYTKWEADRDEVDVEFKQQTRKRQSSWFSGIKGTVLKVLLIIVTFLLGLIIGYVIRLRKPDDDSPRTNCLFYTEGYERYSSDLSKEVMSLLDKDNIRESLRNYTSTVHMTGTHDNNALKDRITQQLTDYGLSVTHATYNVLLSYPVWENPSSVYLLSENGSVVSQTVYHGPPHNGHPELMTPYLAFAPNGTVSGDLVYANYGEESDFNQLPEGSCQNNIIIMRYGNIFRGRKVDNARKCGAIGAILFSDPAEVTYHATSEDDVYPNTWYLPGWAAQRGNIILVKGDPLSPEWPATEGMHRISKSEASLPEIPALPVGYDDAHQLMMYMSGKLNQNFIGAMHHNVTYRTGPGYTGPRDGWKIKLEVNNEEQRRDITDIMAVIKGQEEPDRYVIIGCHYDAWTFGASDPNAGTAVLTEIARALKEMEKKGWKPRRTIMLMYWDAEEQGLMGSYEWVEEHGRELAERTVAYINIDAAIRGNYSLAVKATPEIKNIMLNVTKMFPAADRSVTLYDQWNERDGDDATEQPRISDVGSGSDQAAFLFRLGIPILWSQYMHDTRTTKKYPAYHTDIDNFDYQTRFIDPGFAATEAYTKMTTELLLQLSCLTQLPIDVRDLAQSVSDSYNSLKSYLTQAAMKNISLIEPLHKAIGELVEKAALFHDNFQQVDIADVIETRRYNDRAMKLSQSFIHPEGLPGRPQYKNVLFAPSIHNDYSGATFTGIRDSFTSYEKSITSSPADSEQLWEVVLQQISVATFAVQRARNFLSEDFFP